MTQLLASFAQTVPFEADEIRCSVSRGAAQMLKETAGNCGVTPADLDAMLGTAADTPCYTDVQIERAAGIFEMLGLIVQLTKSRRWSTPPLRLLVEQCPKPVGDDDRPWLGQSASAISYIADRGLPAIEDVLVWLRHAMSQRGLSPFAGFADLARARIG